MSDKPACPRPSRRSIIAAASGLALGAAWGNSSRAQDDDGGLPDAADAMVRVMPSPAPRLVFANAAGRAFTLQDFAGHALVVNLWATWCGPCVAELPSFAALAPKLKAVGGLVLPVSIDLSGVEAVKPFYASHGISGLPILLDSNGANMQVLNTDAIPVSIVVNAAGQMVARMDGAANWNTPRVVAFFKGLGGVAPAGAGDGFTPV